MAAPESPRQVSLVPAHPSYGAVSMRRYWTSLTGASLPGDRFQFNSVLNPEDYPKRSGMAGRIERFAQRRFLYPSLVRRRVSGAVAHVLDHSWADMLRHVPDQVFKVITVHDLIPLRDPGGLTPAQQARFQSWVNQISLADLILADSAFTKSDSVSTTKTSAT